MSGVRVQNTYGQPLDRVWIRLAINGIWTQTPYKVGVRFEALDKGVLVAVLKSFENFFAISKLAAALCKVDIIYNPIETVCKYLKNILM